MEAHEINIQSCLLPFVVALVGVIYRLNSKRTDENTKAVQDNTKANMVVVQSVTVLGTQLEGYRRESQLEFCAVKEKLKEHDHKHAEHEKEHKRVRARIHDVGDAANQALGFAQLNGLEFKKVRDLERV